MKPTYKKLWAANLLMWSGMTSNKDNQTKKCLEVGPRGLGW